MPMLFLGVIVLVLALWALNVVSKVDPHLGARVLKAGGGLLSLGMAVFLGLRGEIGIAIPIGIFGLGMLGWMPFGPAGFSDRTQKSGGQTFRRASDDVAADEFADLGSRSGSSFDGCSDRADIAADDGRDVSTTDIDSLDDLDTGRLGHRVGRFDQGQEAFGFNQSNCILHNKQLFL